MQLEALIENIDSTCNIMQAQAINSVSRSLTLRNWIIGYYIVEYEQMGQDRAKYGDKLIVNISKKLSHIRGLSTTNLKLFKMFYLSYPQISQTVSDQFKLEHQKSQTLTDQSLNVSIQKLLQVCTFSHFVELVKIDDDLKRTFYEVETIKGNWRVRELKRQINSQTYERIGLSKDKKEIAQESDNPPIGLILCANKNHTKVEYATAGLDNALFVSNYKVNLPSIAEMTSFIEDELELLERGEQ